MTQVYLGLPVWKNQLRGIAGMAQRRCTQAGGGRTLRLPQYFLLNSAARTASQDYSLRRRFAWCSFRHIDVHQCSEGKNARGPDTYIDVIDRSR
jgi:hypothetical protein